MKRFLFKRIAIPYVIIGSLLLIILELYISGAVKDNFIANLQDSLLKQARLIAGQIPSPSSGLDNFCRQYKEKTGARITIIDSSGKVLGDSDEPSESMGNHADRPEIRDADIKDVGTSIRYSSTLRKNLFYLALALGDTEKIFLRLSLPLQDIEKALNVIRMRIIFSSLIVLCIAIIISLYQTRKITRSIEDITDYSKDIAAGNFRKRLFTKEKGELEELGRNISDMAEELHDRLAKSVEERQKIEAILRNMSDGLVLTDMKGRIVLSNTAIRDLFGIPSNIEGKTLTEALRRADLMEVVGHVSQGKEKISREIEIHGPQERYLMTTAAPFSIKGELSGVVFTFHDITRLRKLEEVRKDFVANVSHEIKTPITAIKGFAETLLDGALDDRENARKFLETIKNHSERLNSLVSDLLTLSRIELGDIQLERTLVSLDEIIDAVFATLQKKATTRGLTLNKELPPDCREISADRDRLIQILLNLTDNGIKFTEKGGVTIKVESEKLKVKSEEEAEQQTALRISVEDTGVGIPKKHLARLGERFYRVDRARSRELGGTGLGLAIVKHLVIAHGWDMQIESIEGTGTKAHILCPLA
jgi:two-component system, OmpR family, phosphate regulon sensor histidine kinase PhoR